MPKIKTTVGREYDAIKRSDAGHRRRRPRGNADMGTGYRVHPETHMPEQWCSNCETYKHLTCFRKISSPRSRRVCNACEERLSKRSETAYGIMSTLKGPYGGETKFGNEIWRYMKSVLSPAKGPGSRGKQGRPPVKGIRSRAVSRILAGEKKMPATYPALLQRAILDLDDRVHFKSRLWLVFRKGVLDDRQLRLCGCALVDRLMDSVTARAQDDIYFGLGSVAADMRALSLGRAYYSRQRLENLRFKVSAMETELNKREGRKEFDHVARRIFFVLTALLSGSALIALRSIAYDYVEYFKLLFESKDTALQDMLERVCSVLDTDTEAREHEEIQEEDDAVMGRPDALVGTYWQEYDHHSTTRFLTVTDVHKHAVQLRVINNNDTPEEAGEYTNSTRAQFEGMGPGYFVQLFPEDIRDSGVSLGKINRRLVSWGLVPLRTEIDDARERLKEIESEEAETDTE